MVLECLRANRAIWFWSCLMASNINSSFSAWSETVSCLPLKVYCVAFSCIFSQSCRSQNSWNALDYCWKSLPPCSVNFFAAWHVGKIWMLHYIYFIYVLFFTVLILFAPISKRQSCYKDSLVKSICRQIIHKHLQKIFPLYNHYFIKASVQSIWSWYDGYKWDSRLIRSMFNIKSGKIIFHSIPSIFH